MTGNSIRLAISTLVLALLCACKQSEAAKEGDPASRVIADYLRDLDDAVLEAAYRWIIGDLAERGRTPQVYFVEGRRGKDPSDALLSRLAGLGVPIRKSSTQANSRPETTRDPETGAREVTLKVTGYQRIGNDLIDLDVRADFDPDIEGPSSEGANLILQKEHGAWIVREVKARMIGIAARPDLPHGVVSSLSRS